MEKQRWEESEKRRAEERRSEKRKSGKKEDSGARKYTTFRTLLDVQMPFRVAGAKDCAPGSCRSFSYNRHYTTLHFYIAIHYIALH